MSQSTSVAALTPSVSSPRRAAPEAVPRRWRQRLDSLLTWLRGLVQPLLGALVLIAAWQVLAMTGIIPPFVVPSPVAVGQALVDNAPVIAKHAGATLTVALLGFAIGTVCAIAFAVLFTYSRLAKAAIFPTLIALRSLPFIAVIPILIVILGTGYEPRIVVCALGSFFLTLINTMRGLRSADGSVEELMLTLDASQAQRLVKVRLFAALPYLLTAMRVSASGCVMEATVAEWLAGNSGLGYLIQISGYQFRLDLMWAALFVAAALTLLLVGIITAIERVAMPWVPAEGLATRSVKRRKAKGGAV